MTTLKTIYVHIIHTTFAVPPPLLCRRFLLPTRLFMRPNRALARTTSRETWTPTMLVQHVTAQSVKYTSRGGVRGQSGEALSRSNALRLPGMLAAVYTVDSCVFKVSSAILHLYRQPQTRKKKGLVVRHTHRIVQDIFFLNRYASG